MVVECWKVLWVFLRHVHLEMEMFACHLKKKKCGFTGLGEKNPKKNTFCNI